jgi:hypothetical protein
MLDVAEWVAEEHGSSGRRTLSFAMVKAFYFLVHQTRFYWMIAVGRDYETRLESALGLIADEEMEMYIPEVAHSQATALELACSYGRD